MRLDEIEQSCKDEEIFSKRKTESMHCMYERQQKQNEEFVWSSENVAKIIRLNDKLWALMQFHVDRVGKSIHNDIQKLIDDGKKYYRQITPGRSWHILIQLKKDWAADADCQTLYDRGF